MGVLVGKKAPEFTAKALVNGQIVEEFSLANAHGKNAQSKYIILFSIP